MSYTKGPWEWTEWGNGRLKLSTPDRGKLIVGVDSGPECEGAGGLEMNTDQLIAKLDELIAATRSAAIPANMRWLSAESMAAMLDMSPRQFAERLACKPGFPKPAREGHPRWNVAEVHEWMKLRRDERVVRRKAA